MNTDLIDPKSILPSKQLEVGSFPIIFYTICLFVLFVVFWHVVTPLEAVAASENMSESNQSFEAKIVTVNFERLQGTKEITVTGLAEGVTRTKTFSSFATPTTVGAADQNALKDIITTNMQQRQASFAIKFQPSNLDEKMINNILDSIFSDPANIDLNFCVSGYSCSYYPNEVTFDCTYVSVPANIITVATKDELGQAFEECLKNASPSIIVRYTGLEEVGDIGQVIEDRMDLPGNDYSKVRNLSYSTGSTSGMVVNFGKQNGIQYTASFTYVETAQETAYVDDQVSRIIGNIIKPGMTNEQKEKAVHDYIILTTAYDTTLQDHSAYGALTKGSTVCQGYALLGYKMLKAVGLEVRIVLGTANSLAGKADGHAWNLVKVDDRWYHLDLTWDDPLPDSKGKVSYAYYNLMTKDINMDHFITSLNIPTADTPYITFDPDILAKSRTVNITGISLTPNTLELAIGETIVLVFTVTPDSEDVLNQVVYWKSSDPSVATVDSAGKIIGISVGKVTITVTSLDESKSANCIVMVSTQKLPAQQNIPLDKKWRIKFSQAVDATTLQNNINLWRIDPITLTKVIVDITPIQDPTNVNVVIVEHSVPFVAGASYELTVSIGVKDISGRTLANSFSLAFNT